MKNKKLYSYFDYVNEPWGKLFYLCAWKQLPELKGKKILDFGSGFGITAEHLSKDNDVIAVEPSEDMIKIALSGKIENASVVLNTENSEYILEVHNGLDSIETITKLNDIMLTLQCRILDKEGVCIGYKAKDESGKSYNLTVNKLGS